MAPRPQATLQQQFKITNYIGLAMMGAVFFYALLVLAISKGYLPVKLHSTLSSTLTTNLSYIFLVLAVAEYFILSFLKKISLKSVSFLQPLAIASFALCESVSVLGLVLFFLTGNANDFFIFMVISLLYFYLFYPKYADWEKLAKQD
jgi:F0F1-type ATP synthase membrane subunit c/vacuolar-type H+-ATPase subunit K